MIGIAAIKLDNTLLIAIPFFKLPGGIATGGVIEGFYQGIIPIGYIVIMAVLLIVIEYVGLERYS
jgi:L-lactate permease